MPTRRSRSRRAARQLAALPLLVALVAPVAACQGEAEEGAEATAGTGSTPPLPPEADLRRGDTTQVTVDGLPEPLEVEVVRTAAEQARGLMGRTELPAGTGMLFAWDDAAPRSFWMADTIIPLDIAWVRDGQVVGVTSMEPCRADDTDDCERYPSPGAVDAAIESPPGTFDDAAENAAVDVQGEG